MQAPSWSIQPALPLSLLGLTCSGIRLPEQCPVTHLPLQIKELVCLSPAQTSRWAYKPSHVSFCRTERNVSQDCALGVALGTSEVSLSLSLRVTILPRVIQVSSYQPLTEMHQKKRGARQPQRPSLPSIPDHHGWQLWGTVCWILNVRSESLVLPETKLKPITARYPSTHPRGPVLRLGRSGLFNDIRPLSVPSLTGQEDPVRPGCQFNDMVGPCV